MLCSATLGGQGLIYGNGRTILSLESKTKLGNVNAVRHDMLQRLGSFDLVDRRNGFTVHQELLDVTQSEFLREDMNKTSS